MLGHSSSEHDWQQILHCLVGYVTRKISCDSQNWSQHITRLWKICSITYKNKNEKTYQYSPQRSGGRFQNH